MIDVYEVMKTILPYRNDDLVVPTEMAVSAWADVTVNPELDVPNFGSLITIADQDPKNLYHIVLDNEMNATTGGQPVPNAGEFSFARIAMECGYPKVYEFTDIDSWCTQMSNILFEDGPVMVVFKSLPLMPDWSKSRRRELKSSAWLAHNSID